MNTLILTLVIIFGAYFVYAEFIKESPLREHSKELHSYVEAALSKKEREHYNEHPITKREYHALNKACLPQLSLYLDRVTLRHS